MATIYRVFSVWTRQDLVLLNTWKHFIFITTLNGDYSYLHFADEVKDPVSTFPKLIISRILAPNYDPVMPKVSTWPGSLYYSPEWTPYSDDGPNFLLHQHCFYVSASSLCLKYLIGFCLASGIPIILQDPEDLDSTKQMTISSPEPLRAGIVRHGTCQIAASPESYMHLGSSHRHYTQSLCAQ